MISHKFELIGITILVIALTLTLGSCDMGDDTEDAEPTMYELTVEMEGNGIIFEDGEELLEEEDSETTEAEEYSSITLEAKPNEGWKFWGWDLEWSEVDRLIDKKINVAMDEDRTVTAYFEKKETFEVDITNYPEEVTGIDEDVELEAVIENTGSVEETQEILFKVDDEEITKREINLKSEESQIEDFTFTPESEHAGETLSASVISEDSQDIVVIEIKKHIIDYEFAIVGSTGYSLIYDEPSNTLQVEAYIEPSIEIEQAKYNGDLLNGKYEVEFHIEDYEWLGYDKHELEFNQGESEIPEESIEWIGVTNYYGDDPKVFFDLPDDVIIKMIENPSS